MVTSSLPVFFLHVLVLSSYVSAYLLIYVYTCLLLDVDLCTLSYLTNCLPACLINQAKGDKMISKSLPFGKAKSGTNPVHLPPGGTP